MAGNFPDCLRTIWDINFGLVSFADDWLFQFDVPEIIPNNSDGHKAVIPAGGKAASLKKNVSNLTGSAHLLTNGEYTDVLYTRYFTNLSNPAHWMLDSSCNVMAQGDAREGK